MSDNVDIFGHILGYGAAVIASLVALYTANKANKAADEAAVASVIANEIAEKNLNTAAELEIIKLREKWISNVREEMTAVISLASIHPTKNKLDAKENTTQYLTSFTKLTLLLSHDEKSTVEFYKELTSLRESQSTSTPKTPEIALDLGKKILKGEWKRLIQDIENAKEK